MSQKENHGLIEAPLRPKDWLFGGGVSGITEDEMEVLREDGQWDAFLPVYEPQYSAYFDTMACVSYGELNPLETLMFRKYTDKVNFSDRFLAKESGTTLQGNEMGKVGDVIRNVGLVPEEAWPFGPWIKSWDTYYADVPQELIEEAAKFKAQWKINYAFVSCDQDSLISALRYSPLTVSLGGHIVMLYGYQLGQKWKYFDNYPNELKTKDWDFRFKAAMVWFMSKRDPNQPPMAFKFQEGFRYFVKGKHGYTVFNFGGKIRYDDLAKGLDQWLGRGRDLDVLKMSGTVTPADLAEEKVYDLSGKLLGLGKELFS